MFILNALPVDGQVLAVYGYFQLTKNLFPFNMNTATALGS